VLCGVLLYFVPVRSLTRAVAPRRRGRHVTGDDTLAGGRQLASSPWRQLASSPCLGVVTVIAHLYTSRLYNTHYITERNSIALAWDSPHLQRSWRDHPEMIRDLVISGVK